MRKAIEAALLGLALCGAAAALEITGVSPAAVKGARQADFTFSGVTVRGITFSDGAVVLPATEYKGKTYQDIKLLTRSVYSKIEGCFRNGCSSKNGPAPKVKVEGFSPLQSKVRVANAEVVFDGELAVTAGVMASSKEPGAFWISFPAALSFRDPAFKSAVESAVIAAWAKKQAK